MEIYNNETCISYDELTSGIMTPGMVKILRHRGQLRQVRRGCRSTSALFAVDSLPLKYKTEVYKRYPDEQEIINSRPFLDSIRPDADAIRYYEEYVLPDGRHLPTADQEIYANGCAILNACHEVMEQADSHRLRQSKPRLNKGEFWQRASEALPRLEDMYPHNLPSSARRLQAKYNEYLRTGYEALISVRYGNQNSAKIVSEEQNGVMVTLLSHHNNLDNVAISNLYNYIASAKGWKPITSSAVAKWRESADLLTSAGRQGVSNFRNTKSMQVKRSRPTAPFLYWTLDGWEVELLYQSSKTDSKGHTVTTYHNRLTLEVVLDPCCNYPIGYAIGTHETPELIKEALRNAARHSRELFGTMLRTHQLQCDHYAIKAMTPYYNVMSAKVTPARVKNAKAKVVEPYFGYLNKKYCKMMNNWSGYGVTTDPKRQPNAEMLNQLRHTFPDEQGVREQIESIIAMERQAKVSQLRQMMEGLGEERKLPLSKELYLLHFGVTNGHTIAIEGCGLRPRLLGVRREYDCFDIRFREHQGEKWTVRYDPDDMSEVLATNESGTLRFMLSEKYTQPMALADRKEGDAEELARVRAFNRSLENHVTERLAIAHASSRQVIEALPQNDTLHRLLICDSRGRHKDQRSQARKKQIDVEALEVKTIEVPITNRDNEEEDDYSIF